MPKTYILLKDLPDCKAGTKFTFDGNDNYDYKSEGDPVTLSWYRKSFVENNAEWFQEELIQEQAVKNQVFNWHEEKTESKEQFVWTDELVKDAIEFVGLKFNKDIDIREQINMLTEEYKASKQKTNDKEYEILSFLKTTSISDVEGLNIITESHPSWNMAVIDSRIYVPYSVKRVVDETIFNIGDITDNGKITGFKYFNGWGMCLMFENNRRAPLADIKKVNTPILTMADRYTMAAEIMGEAKEKITNLFNLITF